MNFVVARLGASLAGIWLILCCYVFKVNKFLVSGSEAFDYGIFTDVHP
jgi:hypothetical protein